MADRKALMNEFKAAFEAGERPNPQTIVERASPDERQTLEAEIDSYLMHSPRRAWDAAAYASSPARESVERVWESLEGASATWPELLPDLRNKAKIKRAELVERLADALGVRDRAEKVGTYYHRMERGELSPGGISGRVFDALGEILGVSAERIRAAGVGTADGGPEIRTVHARLAFDEGAPGGDMPGVVGSSPGGSRSPEPRDEVDELFTGA